MLDVQQVRLRFIFVRALYPVSLFSKALEVCVLLRCCASDIPRLFQKANGKKLFRSAMDGGGFKQQ